MWLCHLPSRTTAFLVCNTVSVSWKVMEQNPEPRSTKKDKTNKRLFFTPQDFYSAWKALEDASVLTGEQILATHQNLSQLSLVGTRENLGDQASIWAAAQLLVVWGEQAAGRVGVEWGPGLRAGQKVLPCTQCNVDGEGDPVQQGASKSVCLCRGKGETQQWTLDLLPAGAESHLRKANPDGGQRGYNKLLRHFEFMFVTKVCLGFPGGSDDKESVCNAGNPSLIPGSGRSPGEGNGNPLQYSYQENSMHREAWRASVHGVAKNRMQLRNQHFHFLSQRSACY